MRSIIKLGVFLLVVAGLAGLCLGYVNGVTSPVIDQQKEQEKVDSFKEVYSRAQEVKNETQQYLKDPASLIKEINVAYKNGAPVGVIYNVESAGYGGTIRTMVAFDIATQKITGVKVLSHSETPGLGARSTEDFFRARFEGKGVAESLEVVKQGPASDNQVQAITAATVTSKSIVSGINAARENFTANFCD
jgi:electron transport complex protein RnfG